MKLIFGQDASIAEWVARRIPHMHGNMFVGFTAIGIADGTTPIAGVVYTDHIPEYSTVKMHAAASDPRWAQRGIIHALLSYPFDQLEVNKVWASCPISNKRAIRFNRGIGFVQEGILRRHYGKAHAVILGMLRKEFDNTYKELH